jgi:hypothetical protein
MGYFILIAIAIIIAAVVVFILVFLSREKRKAEQFSQRNQKYLDRQDSATWGKAIITNANGGVSGDGATQVRIKLTLDVFPPDGTPYRASTTWLVDITALGSIQQGEEIQIKIDAADNKMIYPAFPWAKYIHA